jgi:hypothetical protein
MFELSPLFLCPTGDFIGPGIKFWKFMLALFPNIEARQYVIP